MRSSIQMNAFKNSAEDDANTNKLYLKMSQTGMTSSQGSHCQMNLKERLSNFKTQQFKSDLNQELLNKNSNTGPGFIKGNSLEKMQHFELQNKLDFNQ